MSTFAQVCYEEMQRQRVYHRLAEHPNIQAEAIAAHYMRHAMVARDLLHLIVASSKSPANSSAHIIDMLVKQIKQGHEADLGLRLEWEVRP
jgi:hypothetical protein